MARRNREVGFVKTCVLSAALATGLATAAQADNADNKLALSGSAWFLTDYLFRGVSQTGNEPAVQAEFDATYGIFWAYMWGSNIDFADSIEIDYGIGISPKWRNITFTIGGLYYTYPGFNDDLGYFEAKTGAAWASGPWALSITDYWSPDNFQAFGNSNAIEGQLGYTFSRKLWNFFTPTISGGVGFQSYEEVASDYTYWNAGLTLGFLEHWSADIRYWDTDYNGDECLIQSGGRANCDARAVGYIKATF